MATIVAGRIVVDLRQRYKVYLPITFDQNRLRSNFIETVRQVWFLFDLEYFIYCHYIHLSIWFQ